MTWNTWAWFALTETMLCLTPGPAVLLVISQALLRGWRRSVWSTLGILAANCAYFVVSATGLGAIILASHDLFFAVKWLGAAYLIWLGLGAIFRRRSVVAEIPSAGPAAPDARRLFANGFMLQAANPKALLFFTALLPQFIDPAAGVPFQVAILATTSVSVEFAVLLGYGLLSGQAAGLARLPRFAAIADRVAGSLLVAAGVRLAAIRES
ncbi:MAG TPA: LysE family translocator [Candidatus Cybelea sp.]|nr:LysE family translocator [Candidatus Cybelea sp.]